MLRTITDRKSCKDSSLAAWWVSAIQRLLIALVAVLWTSGSLLAAETRTVIADPTLAVGPIHRFFLGADYRALWTAPVEMEVLDLNREAGGLTPLFRVGGAQTFGLAFKGADGKSYTFRSLVKSQVQSLHESLRDYAVGRIAQDQSASIHPASTTIVPPLAKAAGLLHNEPRLVVLPDDPALGEFQEFFAGRVGTIEQFPTPASDEYEGFQGATEIIKSFELVEKWLASPDTRIDARALLRSRLFEFFLGDWDRHANNYRWAKIPGKLDWQPLPEDRDQAFADFQGAAIAFARPFEPRLLRYKKNYPSSIGLTSQGWPVHRWFLAELERDTWIEIANDLRNRITDEVINDAVSRMPKPYFDLSADKLVRLMKSRRDKLPDIAERIYRYMNAEIDVQATDESERIDLRYLDKGLIEVSIAVKNGDEPYFKRQVSAADTKSLRLYLRGGQNTLVCHTPARGGTKIEVIGARANDVLEGCKGANLRFTEAEEIERRKTLVRIAPNPFEQASVPTLNIPPEAERPRDWRTGTLPVYTVRANSDDGLVLGGGAVFSRFQFGKNPFGQRHTLSGGVSVTRGEFEATYAGVFQHWNPRLQSSLTATIDSIDLADFFGFGNETSDSGDSDFFETEQTRATITPALDYVLSPKVNLIAGLEVNFNSTDDNDDSLLNELAPLGVGDFNWVNLFAGVDYDTRDKSVLNSPGFHLRLQADFSPSFLDVEGSFNSVEGEVEGFIGLGSRSLLALRLGGRNVSGDFPFQEAAYLGGRTNLRGFDDNRFAGDASVFGTAEYRYSLGEASAYVARAEYGVFVFSDIGRVFLDEDEDADEIHPSAGIGFSITGLDKTFGLSLSIARSDERTTGNFVAGYSF